MLSILLGLFTVTTIQSIHPSLFAQKFSNNTMYVTSNVS